MSVATSKKIEQTSSKENPNGIYSVFQKLFF